MPALASDSIVDLVSAPAVEARACYELRVYVRDVEAGRAVKFISDQSPVGRLARLDDTAIFDTQADADRAARACDNFLSLSGWPADERGWHTIPAEPVTLIANLLRAARKNAETSLSAPEANIEPVAAAPPIVGPAEPLPRDPRRWPRRKEARFCFKMGQGFTAKQVAYDPEIRSTPDACYQRARELGLSFREVPTGQVTMRVPMPLLLEFDKAAAESGRTREAIMEGWLNKLASELQRKRDSKGRYGLVAI